MLLGGSGPLGPQRAAVAPRRPEQKGGVGPGVLSHGQKAGAAAPRRLPEQNCCVCLNVDITHAGDGRSQAVPGMGQGGGPAQPRLLPGAPP